MKLKLDTQFNRFCSDCSVKTFQKSWVRFLRLYFLVIFSVNLFSFSGAWNSASFLQTSKNENKSEQLLLEKETCFANCIKICNNCDGTSPHIQFKQQKKKNYRSTRRQSGKRVVQLGSNEWSLKWKNEADTKKTKITVFVLEV